MIGRNSTNSIETSSVRRGAVLYILMFLRASKRIGTDKTVRWTNMAAPTSHPTTILLLSGKQGEELVLEQGRYPPKMFTIKAEKQK